MEARQTLTGSSVPKALVVMLAVSIAIALAAMGGIAAKDFGASGAAVQNSVHPAAGTVLRQDNPLQSSTVTQSVAVGSHISRSSGTQSDPVVASDDGSQADLTRVLPTETQGQTRGQQASWWLRAARA